MQYRKRISTLPAVYAIAAIILAAIWSSSASAAGKGHGIEVLALAPGLVSAGPGAIISLRFRVTNSMTVEEDLSETISLPPGWQTIIPPMPFSLTAAESTVRIVAIQVPNGMPAGSYPLTYRVLSQQDPTFQDADTATIVVLPVTKLALLLEEKPENVIAGQNYQSIVRVINKANSATKIAVTVEEQQLHAPLRIEPATMTIPAGGSQTVIITVPTDVKLAHSVIHRLLVKASAIDKGIVATLSIEIPVLARATVKNDIYNVLHTEFILDASGHNGVSGLQTTWKGAGALDETGTRQIDFLFQLPDTRGTRFFGQPDEYHLAYTTRDMNIRLGDQTVGLSALTDNFHYGRGIDIDLRNVASGNDVGAYHLGDRWNPTRQETTGAYFRHTFWPGTWIKVNGVDSSYLALTNRVPEANDLCSVEAATTLAHGQYGIQMEYAGSSSTQAAIPADAAYHVEVNGMTGRQGRFLLSRIQAGPDFTGYYHDSASSKAAYAYSVTPCISANVSYTNWQENLEQRLIRSDAPYEQLRQASLQWQFAPLWNMAIGVDDERRIDRLAPTDYSTRLHELNLTLGRSGTALSWNAEYRLGRQEDLLTQTQAMTQKCQLYSTYRFSPQQFVTLYGGYSSNAQESHLLGANRFIGTAMNWTPSACLLLSGWLNANVADTGMWSRSMAISARYAMSGGCVITLQAMRGTTADTTPVGTAFRLTYTIPLDILTGKRKDVGMIRGRVFDATRPNKPGIPNVVLSLNGAGAVTDTHGNFIFPALPPGQYLLNVDRKSIGLQRITDRTSPISLTITGGKTTTVEIGVINGASLSGAVLVLRENPTVSTDSHMPTPAMVNEPVVQGDPNRSESTPGKNDVSPALLREASIPLQTRIDLQRGATGLGNILIELTNGQEVLRRMTDDSGQFLFERLHPGTWHLKAYGYNLPPYHKLEVAEFEVTIQADSQAVAYFRVLPTVRKIIMIANPDDAK